MKVAQAKQQAVSENPFYGCRALLTMQKFFEKVIDDTATQSQVNPILKAAWAEADTKEKKEMFFVIIFSAGDITNREHNMFGSIKVQQGGHSKRKAFRYACNWILMHQAEAFYSYLPLIAEYTNYENLFFNQLRTDRKSGALISHDFLPVDQGKVVEYLAQKVLDTKTTEFELSLIAKFLPKWPGNKRYRKDKEGNAVTREKKQHTVDKDTLTKSLIITMSERMGWEKVTHKDPATDKVRNVRFVGYEKFRSKYLALTEAHLFSSQKIKAFDKVQFLTWLEGLPAGARYRVQCRILDEEGTAALKSNGKWKLNTGDDMGDVYLQWIADKEVAMKKLVSLSDEDKKNMDKGELKALTKQSKVTTGGTTLFDSLKDLYSSGSSIKFDAKSNVRLQTIIDKVKLDVPVMTCIDVSGSMGNRVDCGNGLTIDRIQFAKLIASVMLYKNPNEDLGSMFTTFGSDATLYYDEAAVSTRESVNRYVQGDVKTKKLSKLADRSKPFSECFKLVDSLFRTEGVTKLNAVSKRLKAWVDEDPSLKQMRVEAIQQYPVWLIISDGDFNNNDNGPASLLQFKSEMLQWFGADPVIVLWDILDARYSEIGERSTRFENIDNFIHLAGVNPASINQVFLNINDIQVLDIYTSLETLYKSDRYAPVKLLTV